MALIKCKECGNEISDKATTCIHCGCPIENESIIEESEITGIDFSKRYKDLSKEEQKIFFTNCISKKERLKAIILSCLSWLFLYSSIMLVFVTIIYSFNLPLLVLSIVLAIFGNLILKIEINIIENNYVNYIRKIKRK